MIVYGLTDSSAPGVIRYVGKTVQPLRKRVAAHVSRAVGQPRDSHKDHWIRSVLRAGHQVEGVVIAWASTDDEAYRLEHHYITQLRSLGFRLTNGSDYGRGFQGYTHTADAKQKVSAAHKGRVRSAVELEKQRVAHLGWTPSPSQCVAVAEANRRRVHTAETRAKLSAATRGIPKSAEHRAKISAANHRRWALYRQLHAAAVPPGVM